MRVVFGVLGPTVAWDEHGRELALKGPRHRAVLARLIVARRRVVPVSRLVEDLWTEPPAGAVGAVQTFVAALRRALEPDRPPRTPARLLVTEGPGYALRAAPDTVDAWRFETALGTVAGLPAPAALSTLEEALGWWRGPAYAEFAGEGEDWSRAERARLAELRLQAVERRAETLLALGRPADAVPDLDAHLTDHPWREDAWCLLALALYRQHRQGDALAVLRRARTVLTTQLGVDPGPHLRRLQSDILTQSPTLDLPPTQNNEAATPLTEGRGERRTHPPRPAPADEAATPPTQGRGERRSLPARPAPSGEAAASLTEGRGERRSLPARPAPSGEAAASLTEGRGERRTHPSRPAPSGEAAAPLTEGRGERRSLPSRPAPSGEAAVPLTEGRGERRSPLFAGGPGNGVAGDDPPVPDATAQLWTRAAESYHRTVAEGARTRLHSTIGLLRNLAVTGGAGLAEARRHRTAAITAAEEFADPELTARVIGAYDVPAIWTRVDDPTAAAHIVAAAERTLRALPAGTRAHDPARCRLLATIALETRGAADAHGGRGPDAAREAEALARRLDDPTLLAFALNGTFMQSFTRAGLAPRRDAIGAELVELAARHGLVTYEVLGHLIRLQAHAALGDLAGADRHAKAADHLAERHELPLVGVFTEWYGALRLSATGRPAEAETAYRAAATRLEGAGMPGLEHGLLPLALLCLRLTHDLPTDPDPDPNPNPDQDPRPDYGPYRPWAEPFTLLAAGRRTEARTAVRALPEPPHDLLYEACLALEAEAARRLGDHEALERARDRLRPAAAELAGAGSGLLTLGPVERYLTDRP
ncbi:BTAD domain-containing putative transcriptional regulator [Streptomyces kroppenstedtii]|uniref:BTAD domain-containing putative transcriptional regulator n=1 Tax=Streptomyces kroppenstedtii TaxID=3051181 RepID=UPI0028D7B36F|nr:BTAD domain-containing putative transcriptional regulator [Streptomyces sp. DSM 40484]